MLTGFRFRLVAVLALALAATPLSACSKKKPQESSKVTAKSPAEVQKLAESARKSLDGLKAPIETLRARIQELHKEFDPLPPGLPGFGETRSDFYTTADGVGMLHTKLGLLSSRLDAASKAGDASALEELSKEIEQTYRDVTSADRISVELIHRVQPFKKALEVKVEDVLGKGKCE